MIGMNRYRYVRIDLYRYIEIEDEELNIWFTRLVSIVYGILAWTTCYALFKSFFTGFLETDPLIKRLITYVWLIIFKDGTPVGNFLMHCYANKYRKVRFKELVYREITLYDTRYFLDSGLKIKRVEYATKAMYIIQALLGIGMIVFSVIFGFNSIPCNITLNLFLYWFVIFTADPKICRFFMNDWIGV